MPTVPSSRGWLPKDPGSAKTWLSGFIRNVEAGPKRPLASVLQAFKQLIESEPGLKDLAHDMFEEVPRNHDYNHDPTGRYERVRDYQHMLELFNEILVMPPKYDENAARAGMVGAPFNAVLAWPMATRSGHAFFLNKKVNAALQQILHQWGEFLQREESANAVDSWLMVRKSVSKTGLDTGYTFEQLYICDPSLPHWGFGSWDAFFVREFRDGIRPVAAADDEAVIISPCESVTYWRATEVQARDSFWLKGQPYSLHDMLDYDALSSQFIHGTVHQSYVEAESYHRWHAPVTGRIVKATNIPGYFFSQLPSQGFPDPDPTGQNFSLRYLTSVATRCLIFIEAENPAIGLMCFIAVGMMEVSSCEITVQPGQYVAKGHQIGMFHFGGSTDCLVFRPGVVLDWVKDASPPFCGDYCSDPKMIPVKSPLAYVRKPVQQEGEDEEVDGYALVDHSS